MTTLTVIILIKFRLHACLARARKRLALRRETKRLADEISKIIGKCKYAFYKGSTSTRVESLLRVLLENLIEANQLQSKSNKSLQKANMCRVKDVIVKCREDLIFTGYLDRRYTWRLDNIISSLEKRLKFLNMKKQVRRKPKRKGSKTKKEKERRKGSKTRNKRQLNPHTALCLREQDLNRLTPEQLEEERYEQLAKEMSRSKPKERRRRRGEW